MKISQSPLGAKCEDCGAVAWLSRNAAAIPHTSTCPGLAQHTSRIFSDLITDIIESEEIDEDRAE